MSSHAQAFDVENSEAPDGWERALLDHQIESLNRLAGMGMALAGAIERHVTAAAPGAEAAPVLHHAAIDFGRVARAVRMSFALQSRLIADFKTPPVGRAGRRTSKSDAPVSDAPESAADWLGEDDLDFGFFGRPARSRMSKLGHVVRHVAECTVLDPERLQSVLAEAAERLEQDDIHRQIATRPLGEIIALICADLGLEPDWAGVPHKPARLGWATHEDIRTARDFSAALRAGLAGGGPPAAERVVDGAGFGLDGADSPLADSS